MLPLIISSLLIHSTAQAADPLCTLVISNFQSKYIQRPNGETDFSPKEVYDRYVWETSFRQALSQPAIDAANQLLKLVSPESKNLIKLFQEYSLKHKSKQTANPDNPYSDKLMASLKKDLANKVGVFPEEQALAGCKGEPINYLGYQSPGYTLSKDKKTCKYNGTFGHNKKPDMTVTHRIFSLDLQASVYEGAEIHLSTQFLSTTETGWDVSDLSQSEVAIPFNHYVITLSDLLSGVPLTIEKTKMAEPYGQREKDFPVGFTEKDWILKNKDFPKNCENELVKINPKSVTDSFDRITNPPEEYNDGSGLDTKKQAPLKGSNMSES